MEQRMHELSTTNAIEYCYCGTCNKLSHQRRVLIVLRLKFQCCLGHRPGINLNSVGLPDELQVR